MTPDKPEQPHTNTPYTSKSCDSNTNSHNSQQSAHFSNILTELSSGGKQYMPHQLILSPEAAKSLVEVDDLTGAGGEPSIETDMDDRYDMSHQRRGTAVIIVNSIVQNMPLREGWKQDMEIFENVFQRYGFDLDTHVDKTDAELLTILTAVSQRDHSDCDCFVLAVSTHGGEYFEDVPGKERVRDDVIYTRDGKVIKTRQILEMFTDEKCKSLTGKPRLIFLQACRGEMTDDGQITELLSSQFPMDVSGTRQAQTPGSRTGPFLATTAAVLSSAVTEQDVTLDAQTGVESRRPQQDPLSKVDVNPPPCFKDFLVMCATPPGFYAFRRPTSGSWFLQALDKVLGQSNGEKNLLQELTQVIGNVARYFTSNIPTDQSKHLKKMTPVLYTMLTKDVHLTPKQP